MVITVATIICLAVLGLVVVKVDPVGADRLAGQMQKNQRDQQNQQIRAASSEPTATSESHDIATDDASQSVSSAQLSQTEQTGATREHATSAIPDSDVTGAIVKMVSALVIVIAVVYLGLYLLKKTMGKKYAGSSQGALEVLQTAYVGPHKSLSLVRVADRSVLVGVTESQISAITELTAEETERICGAVESATAEKTDSFARLLSMAGDKLKSISLVRKQSALDKVVDTRA